MHCIFIKYGFDKYFRTYEFESKGDRQRVYSHGLNLQEFGLRALGFTSSPFSSYRSLNSHRNSQVLNFLFCKMELLVTLTSQVAEKIKGDNIMNTCAHRELLDMKCML